MGTTETPRRTLLEGTFREDGKRPREEGLGRWNARRGREGQPRAATGSPSAASHRAGDVASALSALTPTVPEFQSLPDHFQRFASELSFPPSSKITLSPRLRQPAPHSFASLAVTPKNSRPYFPSAICPLRASNSEHRLAAPPVHQSCPRPRPPHCWARARLSALREHDRGWRWPLLLDMLCSEGSRSPRGPCPPTSCLPSPCLSDG